MAAILKETIKLDTSQHDAGIRSATQSVGQYKKQVDSANNTIKTFQGSLSSAQSSISGMVSAFRSGDIMGFANGAKTAAGAMTALIPTIGGTTAAVGGLGAAINVALGPVGLAVAAIAGIVAVGVSAGKSVEEFNKSLKDLSALTGMAGQDLKDIGDAAVELSMKFGTSANSIVDSFKLIGSQAPQLLQDKEGLEAVTEAALVLSKAAGIEVEDAAKGITTVMNQMGVSATEATNIINSLAAGSKNGAADVAYLQTAIEKSGTQAANAGMSYQQLIGAIETLAPKFSSADVAGTALKGTLLKLTTQTNSEFNPAIVGLDKALENLEQANLSAADKVKLFGESNIGAAETLIANRDALQQMTEGVTNTNTAYDQMETKGGTLEESFNQLKSTWDAFMITLGESSAIQGCIKLIKLWVDHCAAVIKVYREVAKAIETVVQIIGALMSKLWNNYIKPIWEKIANAITNSAIFKGATKLWNSFVQVVSGVIKKIKKLWNDFLDWLGIGGSSSVEVTPEVSINTDDTKYSLDGHNGGGLNGGSAGGSGKGGKTPKATKTEKAPPTKGSLDDTEAQLQVLQSLLKNTNTNDKEAIATLKDKIAALQKIADAQKIELGLTTKKEDAPDGSLKDIQDKLSKANQQLTLVDPQNTQEIESLKKQIADLTAQEHTIKISFGLEEVKKEAVEGSLKQLQAEISKCKAVIEMTAVESPEYKEAIQKLIQLTAQEQKIKVTIENDSKSPEIISKEQAETIKKANKEMYSGLKDSYSAATSLGDTINDLADGFEGLNGWEIFEKVGNAIFSVIENVTSLVNAINTFSSAMQSASAVQQATSAASVASQEAETTAAVANTAAKSEQAIAEATASGASLPFPANLAAIAAGVAAVIGVIAMIGSFAGGGIVGGNTTVGDYNLVRANKGEMILNNQQQAHLFRLLNGGATTNGAAGGEVKFKISGKELVGVLSNYNSKISKVK